MDSATRDLDPQQMTLFTRIIHAATITPRSKSKTPTGFTSKKSTKTSVFDFPDLPSLNTPSPFSKPHDTDIFSELSTERLFSDFEDMPVTDRPMASSPPIKNANASSWNNFNDFMNIDQFENVDWDAIEQHDPTDKVKTPKKGTNGLLGVETPGREGLRRSPRRAGRE